MKNPPGWSATILWLALSIVVAFSLAAKNEDRSAASSKSEKGSPRLLLADVWNPSIDPTGWWMSEKYDGLRGYWDGRELLSRKGKVIRAPDYFLAELPRDIALDGELWMGRGKFEQTASTVLSETPDDRWKGVHFMVFDAPQAKGTFEQRMRFLQTTVLPGNPFARIILEERCQGKTQLLAERDRVVELGGEGLMLRRPESRYESGRSPTLLKVKPYDDAEATVVAHEKGKGKFEGLLGSLRVRTTDGKEFSIGAGLTNAQRKSPPPIGTTITYRFHGLTAKGLPRFPSYLRVRPD